MDDNAKIVGFVGGNAFLEFVQRVQRDIVGRAVDEISGGRVLFVEKIDVRRLPSQIARKVLVRLAHPKILPLELFFLHFNLFDSISVE